MNTHVLLLLLSLHAPKHKDEYVIPAPQVVCPLTMDEYINHYQWWARKEIRKRQLIRSEFKGV